MEYIPTIEQRLSVITIGANDLVAMKTFYEQIFGWQPVAENESIIFYKMNGFLLSLCENKTLREFIGIDRQAHGNHSVTFGYNVNSRDEVLQLYNKLKEKVTILKEPTEPSFGGIFFYFQDVEGNILEIAQNPFIILDSHKNATGHKPIDKL